MKRVLLFTALLFLLTICLPVKHSVAQLSITPGLTAQQMVDILAGKGIANISNVSYIGASHASGSFTTGATATNLGMSRGVLLTTGSAVLAHGPNNSPINGTHNGLPGDSVLQSIFPGNITNDASVLIFNFTPQGDTMSIRYVFGSDEYPEAANLMFNDAFGIFLSGPNPHGGTYTHFNMATIPGTNLPVSINNINNGITNSGPCVNCQYYINNIGGVFLEYDGFTTVMTTWAVVVPDSTYTIRMVIADLSDGIVDSGVFIEENSIQVGAINHSVKYTKLVGANAAYEGCNDAVVTFSICDLATDTIWIRFDTIMGTATNGVDFPSIPDSVFILPGHDQVSFTISPFADELVEGTEYISLVISSSQNFKDTVTVYISDYFPVSLKLKSDTVINCRGTAHLWVQPSHGVPPYTYNWTPKNQLTNSTSSQPYASPRSTTYYRVDVDDAIGCSSASDSVKVIISLISEHPKNQNVHIGDNAVFNIVAKVPSSYYQWKTEDGGSLIPLVDFFLGQYSGVQTDWLVVSNITQDNNNQVFRCQVRFDLCSDISEPAVINILTGIEEQSEQPVVSIYPNPAKSFITVKTTTELSEATWFLSDVTGRSVLNGALAGKETLIDISGLSSGPYFLTLKDRRGGVKGVQKVIVSD